MNLGDWLKSLPRMESVQIGTLVLDGKEYQAASYKQWCTPPAGAPNQNDHLDERIYVVGERPKKTTKSHWAFTMKGDVRDWCYACYIDKKNFDTMEQNKKQYHPFGVSFILFPWDCEGPVDEYEKYTRLPVEFIPT